MRARISPGRLYTKLTTDFRRVCCTRCAQCVLPVPYTVFGREGRSWVLGELPEQCEECANAIEEIVRRHQAEYDLMDPLAMNLVREAPANRRQAH
jgi:hypothetical protein